jgi:hypothetical protein
VWTLRRRIEVSRAFVSLTLFRRSSIVLQGSGKMFSFVVYSRICAKEAAVSLPPSFLVFPPLESVAQQDRFQPLQMKRRANRRRA